MSTIDLNNLDIIWKESFDSGPGMFSRTWGNVDASVAGQLTLRSYQHDGWTVDSGAMVPPEGASTAFGYGIYSFTVSMDAEPGPYALLWPSTGEWPGPELDVVEVLPGGQAYSTIHWDANPGNGHVDADNDWNSFMLGDVDVTQVHTYTMEWARDHITVYVDGNELYTTYDNIPLSYADGGENSAPSVGMQTWWNTEHQNGDNHITVYEASYAALGSGQGYTASLPAAEITAEPAAEEAAVTYEASYEAPQEYVVEEATAEEWQPEEWTAWEPSYEVTEESYWVDESTSWETEWSTWYSNEETYASNEQTDEYVEQEEVQWAQNEHGEWYQVEPIWW